MLPPDAFAMSPEEALYHLGQAYAAEMRGDNRAAYLRFRHLHFYDTEDAQRSETYEKMMQRLKNLEPLSLSAGGSVLPTSNVYRSSRQDSFETEIGDFPLDESKGGLGLALSLGTQLTHAYVPGREFEFGLIGGYSYYDDPALRTTTLTGSATHRWFEAGRRYSLTASVTDYSYEDIATRTSPDASQSGLAGSASFRLDDDRIMTISSSYLETEYTERDYLNGWVFGTNIGYSWPMQNSVRFEVSAGLSLSDVQNDAYSYQGVTAGVAGTKRVSSGLLDGLTYGLGISGEWLDYKSDFDALPYARQDTVTDITLDLSHSRLTVGDMQPRLSCTARYHISNVALYDYQSVDCALKLDYRF
ncbi:surface lipoprotein assembly modifier [Celeribacter litoreus]|uniref:surface lipoprotein assembly modifier n=1 Tax=Celeribacter litoreus TaxID=2876714 RepID=UPI001CCAE9BC|nr:surface lipoprotein assembly modifier [Celeribacter litoreus]MCA0041990.1 surface lipoprotein assembly modifier [Celeribacter litoreus]